MELPHSERAFIPPEKLTDYLLSSTNLRGRNKAYFFSRLGFTAERPGELELALLEVARSGQVTETKPTAYGIKHVVVGVVSSPTRDRRAVVRTVWLTEPDGRPRLVTAYPF